MRSTEKSKSRIETDEETPSKETVARRRDRKLKDDITNMMYWLEMESIKPSFDVLLQTGLHRGPYSRNFHKKRRNHKSKSLQEGIDKKDHHGQYHGHDRGHGTGKHEASERRSIGDKYSQPSAIHVRDIEKLKTYDKELDREARRMTNFREFSPVRTYKTLDSRRVATARSKPKAGASPDRSLSAMVMRASRLTTKDLDDAKFSRSTYATLPRSRQYHHYPGASVISVEELPKPQRGTYHLSETIADDEYHHHPGTGVISMEELPRPQRGTYHVETSKIVGDEIHHQPATGVISMEELPRPQRETYHVELETSKTAGDKYHHHHYPGSSVISVEELPRPHRGTYHVETSQIASDDDRAWSTGGNVGWQPLNVANDELMTYLHKVESTPDEFTLNAILASQERSKHQRQQSAGASTNNLYAVDDEMEQLHRLLDNPFTGHEYERNLPNQQITFSDNMSSLPYTPKTIITSPSSKYVYTCI